MGKKKTAEVKKLKGKSQDDVSGDSEEELEFFTKKFMSATEGIVPGTSTDPASSENSGESDENNDTCTNDSSSDDSCAQAESDEDVSNDQEDKLKDDSEIDSDQELSEGECSSDEESDTLHDSDDAKRGATESVDILLGSDEEIDKEERCKTEYDSLRSVVADMSFEELQKLKEKVGTKMFNLAMSKSSKPSKPTKTTFKRENKNRPMETTSKRPVSRFKPVSAKKKKQITRDPRFDDLSGEFNETYFKQAYSFLDDVKQREKQKLLKKMKKETDPDKKKQLEGFIKRLAMQEKQQKQKEDKSKREKVWRDKQKELIKDGKKPFFLKNSTKKSMELADRYKELKKSGKVENYMAKKRKKNAVQERKKLPFKS